MIAMTGFFKVQGSGEGAAAGIQRACIWGKAEKTGYSGAAVINSAVCSARSTGKRKNVRTRVRAGKY